MRIIHSLLLALFLAISTPMVAMAVDEAAEKIEIASLPAPVKEGFAKEVPGGQIISAKKLGGDKPRYRLMYKLEGKDRQITLGEDGMRTRKAKEDKDDDGDK